MSQWISQEDIEAIKRGEKVLVSVKQMPPAPEENDPLTPDEKAVIRRLGDAWRLFKGLDRCFDDELLDFKDFLHSAQTLVMARSAVRAFPDEFNHVGSFR